MLQVAAEQQRGTPELALSPKYPSVEIRDGLVFKQGEPNLLETEALRMRLAAAVGERTGRFVVPTLRHLDLPRGELVTEYMPQLLDLRQVAASGCEGQAEVFRAAGRALATVHRELQLPADRIVLLPDYLWSRCEDEVPLHGDFCWSNVCWSASQGKIVLLDWASSPLLGGLATYGCRYFDLLWFSWSLFFWMPVRRFLQWRPERLMRALVSGYSEIEPQFCWQRYIAYRSALNTLVIRYWRGKRTLGPSAVGGTLGSTSLEVLGWLRWRLFPLRGPGR